jgi:homoserine kinase
MKSTIVRVPASSANLGPGFDCLAISLNLHNTVKVSYADTLIKDPFIREIGALFYKAVKRRQRAFTAQIDGKVPISRGLGSSVTVRLGVLFGLNILEKNRLSSEKLLDLAIALEGHPDNAVAAFYGGFAASNSRQHIHMPISSKLYFVAAIPSFELETKKARAVLPRAISRSDVVTNIQYASIITGAFVSKNYQLLKQAFQDRLHQPYRAKLIPGFYETISAAEKTGALGAFLSGAGSTMMAVTLQNPEGVANAMVAALKRAGDKNVTAKILKADNTGMRRYF